MNTIINGVEYTKETIPGKGECLVPVIPSWQQVVRNCWSSKMESLNDIIRFIQSPIDSRLVVIRDFTAGACTLMYSEGLYMYQTRSQFGWHTNADSFIKKVEENSQIKV